MALTKSYLSFRRILSPMSERIFTAFSFSSASEAHRQEDEAPDERSQTAPNLNLPAEETLIADTFHGLIKDHHRSNPTPPSPSKGARKERRTEWEGEMTFNRLLLLRKAVIQSHKTGVLKSTRWCSSSSSSGAGKPWRSGNLEVAKDQRDVAEEESDNKYMKSHSGSFLHRTAFQNKRGQSWLTLKGIFARQIHSTIVLDASVTFSDVIDKGNEPVTFQLLKDIHGIICYRISEGIEFGSLDPNSILIIGNMPELPHGSSTGLDSQSYFYEFKKLILLSLKYVPTDLPRQQDHYNVLFHLQYNCDKWEDFEFILAHGRFQSLLQSIGFISYCMMQLLTYDPKQSFPVVHRNSPVRGVCDFRRITVATKIDGWKKSYNSFFPYVSFDVKRIEADSIEGPTIADLVQGKAALGTPYGTAATDEFSFMHNAYKHFHEKKASKHGRYHSHSVIRTGCKDGHKRVFTYLFYLYKYHPALKIDLEPFFRSRFIVHKNS